MENKRGTDVYTRSRGNRTAAGRRGGHRQENQNENVEGETPTTRPQGRGNHTESDNFNRGNKFSREGDTPHERVKRERLPRQNLPYIRLMHDIKDIKLNEDQTAKIKELDEKLKALKEVPEPSKTEHEAKLAEYDQQIKIILGKPETNKQSTQAAYNDIDSYTQARSPQFADVKSHKQSISQVTTDINQLYDQLKANKEQRAVIQSKIAEARQKFHGIRTREDAERRINEIEETIETSTLSNNDLKRLMSECESIEKILPQFTSIESDEESLSKLRSDYDEIFEKISKLREQRDELYSQKKEISEKIKSGDPLMKEYKDRVASLKDQRKELRDELNNKKNEKRAYNDSYYDKLDSFYKYKQETRKIQWEKKSIYSDAEHLMIQIAEGKAKVGEIEQKINPHQKELSAAQSLVIYLKQIIGKNEEIESEELKELKEIQKNEQKKIDDSNDLIASLRVVKGKKAKKMQKNQKLK